MAEGQTATNPQTGERVVLRGGQWVPVGGGQRPQARQSSALPRGLRNNNPGNIEDGDYARSLPGYAGSDGRFAIFDSPDAGGQAKTRLLGSYINRGFNTPASIINRWAPPSDNNPTEAYADYVARRAGIGVNDQVTQEQIPLIAQAISEFENGNTANLTAAPMPQQAAPSAIQTATNPQTGEKMQLVDGQWQPMPTTGDIGGEIEVNRAGIRIKGGKTQIYDPASGSYYDATPEQVNEYQANLRRSQADRQARLERQADPEYQAAFADAQRGSENVPDQLRALGLGGTLGFLTDINAEAQGLLQGLENAGRNVAGQEIRYGADMARQAARDAVRDDQAAYAAANPIENFALQAAGGLITPGLQAGGAYISGATGAGRLARAAQVGAGYGAVAGAGYGQGNLIERADDAALGAGVGAATGGIGQGVVDRLTRGAVNPATVSQARRLSREGVELTPGQMISEAPLLGPVGRVLEEASSTIPFAGAPVAGARQRSVETFNRAALNRVLGPLEEAGLGARIPTGVRAQIARIGRGAGNPESGYQAVGRVQRVVSDAYDKALDGVEVRPDQTFYDDLGMVVNDASERMTPQLTEQLAKVLENRVFRTLEESDSVLTGQAFKRAESELGALSREQRVSLDPANRALAAALDDTRGVLRDLVARQRPDRASQIQAVNRAYSNLVPIEEAAGSTVAEATEGVFTPTALAQAARRSQTRRTRASGEGRLQDLTAPGKGILNSRIGDSGTATRGRVTALMSGGAGVGAVANPGVAVPIVVGVSALYSRPAQSLLNAVYRATDSRSASEAVQELARLAQRDPALVPYYEGAVQHLLGRGDTDRPAMPPSAASTSAPSAALQRVMQ